MSVLSALDIQQNTVCSLVRHGKYITRPIIRCEPLGEHLIHWTCALFSHIVRKMNNVCIFSHDQVTLLWYITAIKKYSLSIDCSSTTDGCDTECDTDIRLTVQIGLRYAIEIIYQVSLNECISEGTSTEFISEGTSTEFISHESRNACLTHRFMIEYVFYGSITQCIPRGCRTTEKAQHKSTRKTLGERFYRLLCVNPFSVGAVCRHQNLTLIDVRISGDCDV